MGFSPWRAWADAERVSYSSSRDRRQDRHSFLASHPWVLVTYVAVFFACLAVGVVVGGLVGITGGLVCYVVLRLVFYKYRTERS